MDRRRSRLQRDSTKKGNSGGRFGVSTTSLMFVYMCEELGSEKMP